MSAQRQVLERERNGSVPEGPLLEVTGLRKHFVLPGQPNKWGRRGDPLVVRAVEDVSFTLTSGQILTIVGESGCGKSTVARMLVGLVPPSAGEIRVNGTALRPERTRADRRLIQLVSQNPWSALNRRRSIGHALEQPLRVHEPRLDRGERRRRVEEIIDRVGLARSYLDHRPADVSGGELARAVLARALLARPRVVVLDEPTASLDASVKATVVNLLMEVRDQLGLGMILITHELPVARRVADQAVVMYLGRLVETGPANQVLRTPTHPYARMLLASIPSARHGTEILGGKGEIASAVRPPSGCPYHPRCPHETAECRTGMPELARHGLTVVACHHSAELGARTAEPSEPSELPELHKPVVAPTPPTPPTPLTPSTQPTSSTPLTSPKELR